MRKQLADDVMLVMEHDRPVRESCLLFCMPSTLSMSQLQQYPWLSTIGSPDRDRTSPHVADSVNASTQISLAMSGIPDKIPPFSMNLSTGCAL